MEDNPTYLLADTARQMRRAFDERMRALGVTGAQARLLFLLNQHEGEQQGFYADQLEVEPITLCRMIDRLEEARMVLRQPNPADRRSHLIVITEKARQSIAEMRMQATSMADEMFKEISVAERELLVSLLTRVRRRLTEMNAARN